LPWRHEWFDIQEDQCGQATAILKNSDLFKLFGQSRLVASNSGIVEMQIVNNFRIYSGGKSRQDLLMVLMCEMRPREVLRLTSVSRA
jgi:hypothetical protein